MTRIEGDAFEDKEQELFGKNGGFEGVVKQVAELERRARASRT